MIIVDSSVWIDFFNGNETPAVAKLDSLLGVEPLAIGDVILLEVLQGFRTDAHVKKARSLFNGFDVFTMLGEEMAVSAANCYRQLRQRGITIRKSNDVIIANFCITQGHSLLFSDKDFLPFINFFQLKQIKFD